MQQFVNAGVPHKPSDRWQVSRSDEHKRIADECHREDDLHEGRARRPG